MLLIYVTLPLTSNTGMKAIVLKKYGEAKKAFEMRDLKTPEVSESQVLISVNYTGLNFADVMARKRTL
jgi:NADPH2:quinone reductase